MATFCQPLSPDLLAAITEVDILAIWKTPKVS